MLTFSPLDLAIEDRWTFLRPRRLTRLCARCCPPIRFIPFLLRISLVIVYYAAWPVTGSTLSYRSSFPFSLLAHTSSPVEYLCHNVLFAYKYPRV